MSQASYFHSDERCRVEKQKRRLTGFLNKIALKDSTYRHLNVLTSSDLHQMALGFLKVRTLYNANWNQLCSSTALACASGLKIHATGLTLTCFPSHTCLQDAEVGTHALHNVSCSNLDQQSTKKAIIVMMDVCGYVQLTWLIQILSYWLGATPFFVESQLQSQRLRWLDIPSGCSS